MYKHKRYQIHISGIVQGVGFRPFLFRLATQHNLKGWARNNSAGVELEIEGASENLDRLCQDLNEKKPRLSKIEQIIKTELYVFGYPDFQIKESDQNQLTERNAKILPDTATCDDCIKEIFDPCNRRYLYPFTTCTLCGPRYSISEKLPFDRHHTTMRIFTMCKTCQTEYQNPCDRRFHSQTNACPDCGPKIELWDTSGHVLEKNHSALKQAAQIVKEGKILALKGLGGFHLIVDAQNEAAVQELRNRKQRKAKPFALMVKNLNDAEKLIQLTDLEKDLLQTPEAPILLANKKTQTLLAQNIAPNIHLYGLMLAYTPLHHLLLHELDCAIIATSGNLSDEPIVIDEINALKSLKNISDFFLVHNRPICHGLDDSIIRVMDNKSMLLRIGRGFAPTEIVLSQKFADKPILALGGHQKNTLSVFYKNKIRLSQYLGSLDTDSSLESYQSQLNNFPLFYEIQPKSLACDLHPDYYAAKLAKKDLLLTKVQHHQAHVLSCMAEHDMAPPLTAFAWDGSGYGLDQTIWGGETFEINENYLFERIGSIEPFLLIGGELAIKEPRRSALALLYEIFGTKCLDYDLTFSEYEKKILKSVLIKKTNCIPTTSIGRLFDAISALIGLRYKSDFEGQAAMELEAYANLDDAAQKAYPFEETHTSLEEARFNWKPLVLSILDNMKIHKDLASISTSFHLSLVQWIVHLSKKRNHEKVILTGGVFQNKFLLETAVIMLRKEGFQPFWNRKTPINDSGLSLGQALAAFLELRRN
ncbi:carbamoyltransferase HypF [Candidatus Nomurabacteria bacterium]|nr:carbamoyltransferase HypF [Candidatus Nomurabacteria bacterium]